MWISEKELPIKPDYTGYMICVNTQQRALRQILGWKLELIVYQPCDYSTIIFWENKTVCKPYTHMSLTNTGKVDTKHRRSAVLWNHYVHVYIISGFSKWNHFQVNSFISTTAQLQQLSLTIGLIVIVFLYGYCIL